MQQNFGMRRFVPAAVLCAALCIFAACASGGSSTGNGGGSTSTATMPTKTVKTKPTGPITVNQALCDRVLTKDEAGQITKTTVTSVKIIDTGEGGSCNYETAANRAAVFVAFFPGGAAAVQGEQDQLKNQPGFKGTVTPISGLGDSAIGIVNPITAGLIQYHVSVAYGTLFLDCVLPKSTAGDAAAIDQLKQVAQLVLDRL